MPRAGVTRDRVVEEATAMVEAVGWDQLTLAGLAGRLGIKQPSLYKHIDSIAGLRRDISLRAVRELSAMLAQAAVGRSGADAIRSMSRAYRAWVLGHPALYEASQAQPIAGDAEHEAAMLAGIQTIADVLTAYELEGDDAIDAIRAFRSSLHGFVTFESQGQFAIAADINRSFERMVDGFIVALTSWTDASASSSTLR